MKVSVRSAGFLTTVQDLGRTGFRRHGASLGGALDPHALTIANLLVGNHPTDAGLELTLGRVRLRFADDRLVAWCGGAFDVHASGAELPVGHIAFIRAGEEFEAAPPPKGARAWLAISGSIEVPFVLASRATDLRSRFGGLEGRALVDGDELRLHSPSRNASVLMRQLESSHITTWSAPNEWSSPAPRHPFLRIVRGADWSRFRKEAVAALLGESFTVTNASDRMGVRLQGNGVTRDDRDELLSEAVAPGTIQIPGDGQPIVLLGDCQTIGGYPKIAHVITVDLPAAAQLSSGDIVRFAEVTLAEAQQLLLQRARDLAWFRAGLTLKFT